MFRSELPKCQYFDFPIRTSFFISEVPKISEPFSIQIMLGRTRINPISDDSVGSDSSEDSVTKVQPIETAETLRKQGATKSRSWVYEHSEKLETKGTSFFHCRCKCRNGRECDYKVQTKKGQTTLIANHLRDKQGLKPPTKLVQKTFTNMTPKPKSKTFRQAFAELVAKQYLPFSLIDEKVLQDAFIAFLKENRTNIIQPIFVTRKTVAADISKMADDYIAQMKVRFQSKLSLCMDAWTGPNKMSFLGITFTWMKILISNEVS